MKTKLFLLATFCVALSSLSHLPTWADQEKTTETRLVRLCEDLLRFENMDSRGMVSDQVPLNPNTIAYAYEHGFFPWEYDPTTGLSEWYASPGLDKETDPTKHIPGLVRGLLRLEEVHIPRTLKKWIRREMELKRYVITFNRAFGDVMRNAGEAERPGQTGTWITEEFVAAYEELNRRGIAHSVEVWRDGVLVGGACGILTSRFFSGDTMFYREENASRLAFLALYVKLKAAGLPWIDTQQVTGGTAPLGARLVPVDEFFDLLHSTPQNDRAQSALMDQNAYRLVLRGDDLELVDVAEQQESD